MLAILAFLNFLALLHTLSRASWVGFIVTFMALIFFIKKRNFLIFGLVVGLIVAPMALPDIVVERIMYTFGVANTEVTARHKMLDKRMAQFMALSEEQRNLIIKKTGIMPNVDSSTAVRLDSILFSIFCGSLERLYL